MFRIDRVWRYWCEVELEPPDGEREAIELEVAVDRGKYRRILGEVLSEAELRAWLCEVIVGWRGVVDAEGRPVEFDRGLLDELLTIPWVVRPVVRAILAGEARRNFSAQ